MKTHKKFGFVLAIIFGISFTLFLPNKASAANPSLKDAERCEQTLRFEDIAHIVCDTTERQELNREPTNQVTFLDRNPNDFDDPLALVKELTSKGVAYHNVNYKSDGFFPDPERSAIVVTASFSYREGLSDPAGKEYSREDAGKSIKLRLNIFYTTNGTDQIRYGGSGGKTVTVDDTSGILNLFRFSGENIVSLEGVNDGGLSGKSYSLISGTQGFANDDYKQCKGDVIIINTKDNKSTGISYNLKQSSSGIDKSKYPDLFDFMSAQGGRGCGVDFINNYGHLGFDSGFGITGTSPITGTPGSTTPAPGSPVGVTGDDEACYSSNWALSWIACPVITTAQTLANEMYEFVENQLKFRVEDGNQADSLGDPQTKKDVKGAWNNFRILVSGLVVILMLVMVIGQAIGTGLFDAYTVKKMLPRLVMGVIMIQLSWPIFSFVINFADDLGRGLADIMYAPFGGSDALNLKEVMAPYADKSKDGQTALLFSWFSFLGGVIAIVVAPFLVLGAILTILVAIFVAFLTLLFRKILIILSLIFVPVALIAWMMPNEGLRKYWKLWWDNFIKALMMFPLIILIIAAGRIFAKIGSGTSDLVGFFIVLVGFFGPLFILPKTFKWGGTAMTMAGNAMTKAQTASLKKPKEALKGFNERYQGERAKAYSTLDSRGMRAFRRIQSGHFLPTERSRRLTIAAGNKWASERNEEADAMALRTQEKALAGYDYADMDDDGNYLRYSKNAAGEYLDVAGNVVDKAHAHSVQVADRKDASFERLTGVPAGKQALIDLAGNDGKSDSAKRIAQAADKLLIDTHSEIELQNSRIQYGANSGRRVNETAVWKDTITNSPSHYSAINNSRPDFAPDLEESAEQAASRRLGRPVTYQTATAADRREIDADKAIIAIERLTPEQAAQVHYGFYDDIGEVGAQAAIDRRTGAPILDAAGNPMNISQLLAQRLIDFKSSPGTVGANAVGSLHGGKQEHVDSALAASGHTLDTLP